MSSEKRRFSESPNEEPNSDGNIDGTKTGSQRGSSRSKKRKVQPRPQGSDGSRDTNSEISADTVRVVGQEAQSSPSTPASNFAATQNPVIQLQVEEIKRLMSQRNKLENENELLELEIKILKAKTKNEGRDAPLKTLRELAGEERVNDLDKIPDIAGAITDREKEVEKNKGEITEKEAKIANLQKMIAEQTNRVQLPQPTRLVEKLNIEMVPNKFLDLLKVKMKMDFWKDRRTKSANLLKQFGYFEKTVRRADQIVKLLENWFNQGQPGVERAPLSCVAQAPGTGKSHFLQLMASRGKIIKGGQEVVDEEYAKAIEKFIEGDDDRRKFIANLEHSIAITATLNFHTIVENRLETWDGDAIFGCRILFSYLYGDLTANQFTHVFRNYLNLLHVNKCAISIDTAINFIEADLSKDQKETPLIILCLDEVLRMNNLTDTRESETQKDDNLKSFTKAVGKILDFRQNVKIVVSALGTVELTEKTESGSGRKVEVIELPLLSLDQTLMLCKPIYGRIAQKLGWNTDIPQSLQWILRDCGGIPRLVQSVLVEIEKLQNSRSVDPSDYCAMYTLILQKSVEFHPGWRSAKLRERALLAVFDFEVKYEEKDKLMREGYLYRIPGKTYVVPPIVLHAWNNIEPEQKSDFEKAIYQPIIKFLQKDGCPSSEQRSTYAPQDLEIQLGCLWHIRSIIITKKTTVRTISSILELSRQDRLKPEFDDISAVFNRELNKRSLGTCGGYRHTETSIFGVLERQPKNKETESTKIKELTAGMIYMPDGNNENNAGFDFLIVERAANSENLIRIAHEVKYSSCKDSRISPGDVSAKFCNTLKYHPVLRKDFLNGRFCYVFGGMKDFTNHSRKDHIQRIAKDLQKGNLEDMENLEENQIEQMIDNSLVLLDRAHIEKLMTPVLAERAQFLRE